MEKLVTVRICDCCGYEDSIKLDSTPERGVWVSFLVTVDKQIDPAGGRSEPLTEKVDLCPACCSERLYHLLYRFPEEDRKFIVDYLKRKNKKLNKDIKLLIKKE